jgi:hypothetical protein
VSNYKIVSNETDLAAHEAVGIAVNCPSGENVLGGGGDGDGFPFTLDGSSPSSQAGAGWSVTGDNPSNSAGKIRVWAICAVVPG